MSLLKIVTIPAKNLREKSLDITKAEITKLSGLVKNMIETMYVSDGIGLAAPQIGKNIRLATIGKEATPDNKDWVIINPKIIKHSWRKVVSEEGCLSVPGVNKEVARYKKITVKALNQKGESNTFEAEDFFARVLQHEIDHLDGILIIDKE
ncbi:MAG: peptide deformylase [Candidatus Magasanikbacteria bacterium]|nr:peptide deformylase [Candidatus Magasanikbacteria bacterium]